MALLLLGTAQGASVKNFTDVSSSDWYYEAVSYVTEKGLFQGTSTTAFSPQSYMTRGMFITVLGRYAGVDASAWCVGTVTGVAVNIRSGPGTSYSVIANVGRNTKLTIVGASGGWYQVKYGSQTGYISGDYFQPTYHRFSDVDYNSYYAGYAIWAYEKGIVDGMGSSDVFAPENKVTREQICKMLDGYVTYAGLTLAQNGSSVTFSDQSSISSWAVNGVAAMQKAGIVQGEKSGSSYVFRPRSYAKRCEAAAMFQRLAQYASGGTADAPSSTTSPSATAAPSATTAPVTTTDTPATFTSGTVSLRSTTIRVGLLVSTSSYQQSVQTVTLKNTNGSSFAYGTFDSSRTFQQAGTIASASVTVTISGSTFTVRNASGSVVYTGGGNLAIHPVSEGKAITCVNSQYKYYGDFELRAAYNRSGYISVINYVDIEDYVKGVIPYEYGNTWPSEALKAAAITARNFVMTTSWSTYSTFGFDVMAEGSSQVYRGRGISYADSYFTATDAAVEATRGVYLTYNGTLCQTYYFSSDGGATEDSAHVWGGSYGYLVGKIDPYEAAVASQITSYTKTATLSRTGSELSALAKAAGLGNTTIAQNGIQIETYPATGNVKSITLTGSNGRTVTISQSSSYTRWDFLKAFGITSYSYRYTVTYNAATDSFTCTRQGWGHQVGLSQWGAYAMAKYYNKTYQDILGFYYSGTHLQYGA
jgi:stage II sporulation protein D